MEPQQKQRIDDAVRRVIVEDFRGDFEEVFELTFRFTGELLVQAINGIRNALSHLAYALTIDNESQAELEIERARKHIAIAKYDCLSVLLIDRTEYLANYVKGVEDLSGDIAPDLRRRLIEIKTEKNLIPAQKFVRVETRQEIISDIDSITKVNEQIETLVAKCNEYEEDLKDRYAAPDPFQASAVKINPRLLRWVLKNIVWIALLGVLVNIIAAVVYALWIESIVRPPSGRRPLDDGRAPLILSPAANLSQNQYLLKGIRFPKLTLLDSCG